MDWSNGTILALSIPMMVLGYICQLTDAAKALGYLCLTGIAALTGGLIVKYAESDFLFIFISVPFIAYLIGALFAHFKQFSSLKDALRALSRMRYSLFGSRQVFLIVLSLFFAIFATFLFGIKASSTHQPGANTDFWFGFYQSWTSTLVGFLIFGIVGLIVSIHKPSEEHFKQRIANLFGVSNPQAIEYLSNKVEKIGYYCKINTRTYTVANYNHENKSYEIIISNEAENCNFLHDVSASDELTLNIDFDDIDRFDPPLAPMGRLLVARIGEEDLLEPGNIDIFDSGFNRRWQFHIPKGDTKKVMISHSLWIKAGNPLQYRPTRFAERVIVKFQYSCTTSIVPKLTYTTKSNPTKTIQLGRDIMELAHLVDCSPGSDAIELILHEPSSTI